MAEMSSRQRRRRQAMTAIPHPAQERQARNPVREGGVALRSRPGEKHGPNATGAAGPCDADCLKCALEKQPRSIPNKSTPIVKLVLQDLRARAELGQKKYGTYLQANNGRSALRDAYEEVLDLAMYLRQALEEDDAACSRCGLSRQEHKLRRGRDCGAFGEPERSP